MEKVAAVFPVVPGKDASDVADMLRQRPEEYVESRKRQTVHLERAYEMKTPAGTFVIAYIESERPFGQIAAEGANSDLPIDQEFNRLVKEVHGVDLSQPPQGEPPEVLGDWVDETATGRKRGLAFAAPVRPGADEKGRAFAKEAFGTRVAELAESRRAKGITHEFVCLNHTPNGDVIAVYLEGDDPAEGNRLFAESRSEFDTWFKDQCKEIFSPEVDFNQPVPPVTEIFDSAALLVAS